MINPSNVNWVRVTKLDKYIKSEDIPHPDECDYTLARRYYAPKGKKYPLFCISIHANVEHSVGYYDQSTKVIVKEPLSGINISQSIKVCKGQWWDSHMVCIPLDLIDDMYEMVNEIKTLYKK